MSTIEESAASIQRSVSSLQKVLLSLVVTGAISIGGAYAYVWARTDTATEKRQEQRAAIVAYHNTDVHEVDGIVLKRDTITMPHYYWVCRV